MPGFLFGGGAGTTVTATGSTTARSLADRAAEVFNVKDYGAVGDASADDTTPIRNALSAMYTAGGGIVRFPRGSYKVTAPIDISTALALLPGVGRIEGVGVGASHIFGQVDSDFLLNMPHQANGVGEISNLSITNTSTFIGTGALRYAQNNGKGFLHNLYLAGMTSLEMGWNVFNTTVIGVLLEKGGNTSSPYGSIGMTNGGANVFGMRGNFCHEIGMTMVGSNAMTVSGISFEITPVGVVLGQYIGFATNCTITGADGSKKLTVNGTLYPPAAATATPLIVGDQIVTSGVDPRNNPNITITAQDSGTSMEQGVYSLSGANGVTISSGQPITIRRRWSLAGFTLANMETEGCGIGIYCVNATGRISSSYITGGIYQGATNQYGSLTGQNSSPQCSLFVDVCGGLVVDACAFSARTTKATVQFRSDGQIKHTTFMSCSTVPGLSSTSDANAFIDNGAGTTLVTNGATAAGSKVLNFAAGTIPGSVVAGVPVYDVTRTIDQYNYVATVNNGAGTVTLQNNVGGSGVNSGDTIRFCVPSAVAGNVLTVQVIDNTLGRGTTVPAPGLVAATQGGFAVAGAGISTGANTPMISDQVTGGYGQGSGGGGHAQYTLVKADGSAVSLNVGPEVMTFAAGKTWGVDNLTDLSGMDATSKASVAFINCDQTDRQMHFADLPGQAGVHVDEGAKVGDQFFIVDANQATIGGNVTAGGAPNTKGYVVWNGTHWTLASA